MVDCAEEHEAARSRHRLNPRLHFIGTLGIGSKRLKHGRVELAKLPLEVLRDLDRRFGRCHPDVECDEC